jgi:hypothetical protein
VAKINEDPDLKESFEVQMLEVTNVIGQYCLPKLINPYSFFGNGRTLPLHISLALGFFTIFDTYLSTGPSGERNPFQFLECDVRGGDMDQIEDADTANALIQGAYPLVHGKDPNLIVSLSWPNHMKTQDLYPVASSTYTCATGTEMEVPCSAQEQMKIKRTTECPDSFVNPIDPYHGHQCVKVLHETKYYT